MNANGERARSVSLQFLTPCGRKAPDDGEMIGGGEVVEPLTDLPPALLSKPLPQQLLVVTEIAQIRVLE